ncbi:hypothetical protein ESCO_005868 [Escovopsis weberi]|uniref:Uncharacterized protein n=1 Tax=Escovopsis weberi TaxID=150374 RepID=A0A0M8MZV0_ESCWE|nr:hypothetical protein ESCO_005868 [Escovopsis weberi]
MDAASFTLFPLLPPEIRLEIWHIVLAHDWSFTKSSTTAMLGRVCRTAGAANNREARAAMLRVFEPSHLGPHAVVRLDDPDWAHRQLSFIQETCVSLRSLLVVCDRNVMVEHDRRGNAAAADKRQDDGDGARDKWLDWSDGFGLFHASPSEVDITQITRDVEGEGDVHTASRARALAKSWPGPWHQALAEPQKAFVSIHRRGGKAAKVLALVKRVLSTMPSSLRLYLRMRHELPRFEEPQTP